MPKLFPIAELAMILFAVVIGFTMLVTVTVNFFERVRRRRKARMEDGMISFDDWKYGDPNQKVPDNTVAWNPMQPGEDQ